MRRTVGHAAAAGILVVCCACASAVTPPSSGSQLTAVASAPAGEAARAPTSPAMPVRSTLPALDPNQFLSAVSLQVSTELKADTLELLAPSYTGTNLGELDARQLLLHRGSDGRLLVRLGWPDYLGSKLPVNEREKRCSFIADCDEPAVVRVASALSQANPSPTANEVVKFVGQFIVHKHMSRGFDIASVVAEKREGDCTEHAVLTAALLRAKGYPSHIVIGIVMVRVQGKLHAFGHAWAEYHDGQSWQLADATNVTEPRQVMAYLPLRVMRNESPSYGRDALAGLNSVDVLSISVPESLTLTVAAR